MRKAANCSFAAIITKGFEQKIVLQNVISPKAREMHSFVICNLYQLILCPNGALRPCRDRFELAPQVRRVQAYPLEFLSHRRSPYQICPSEIMTHLED